VTKLSKKDLAITASMKEAGVDVYVIPSAETSYMEVVHPSENVDDRRMFLRHNAGFITPDEIPDIETAYLHLAGISDREFSLPLIEALHGKGYRLSADMQGFVRQVSPSGEVFLRDCGQKKEIVRLLDKVKLDIVEAGLLTGQSDLEAAAEVIAGWGCSEVVITEAQGVLARYHGNTYYEKFTNRSSVGRTGRGDTTFAAYLSRRMEYGVPDALKFAAALVSIKMETPGPFQGTLEEVLSRMGISGTSVTTVTTGTSGTTDTTGTSAQI